jgi:hypothetical protein
LQALADREIHRRPTRVSLLILHLQESSEFLAKKGQIEDARLIETLLKRFALSISNQKIEPEEALFISEYTDRQ